ncbi:MAG: anthranilate synthase component I [Planctomycetota bacterium]
MSSPSREDFVRLVERHRSGDKTLAVPMSVRLLGDQLTPVLAYRRLVAPDERTAPSFLLESVEGGERQGRYSILSSRPVIEVVAYSADNDNQRVEIADRREHPELAEAMEAQADEDNPLFVPRAISRQFHLVIPPSPSPRDELPRAFLGGWVGFAAYDTVRYAEPDKLAFATAPKDDRGLPTLHFGFYDGVVIFDHVDKLVHVVQMALVGPDQDAGEAYDKAQARLEYRVEEIQLHTKPLPSGRVDADRAPTPLASNTTREAHAAMVARAMEYIRAGDIFQVVVGQRFERTSRVDPFDVYRALRAVNPSPYMGYIQAQWCILVASSPEILCRVRTTDAKRVVTNRPLAGTRRRGATPEEDLALERELLADQKERAEHIMLVDLGRNDVGQVAVPGTIELAKVMEIERYSHVMHISSTVTGELRPDLDCWDALRAALPVGTISGAPKVRAMQIIDELEPVRRGPYGGGFGYVGLDGQMDIALALRTIVVPVDLAQGVDSPSPSWTYHIQSAGGIVADSNAPDEYQETVNKAAALSRAIDVAEQAFHAPAPGSFSLPRP